MVKGFSYFCLSTPVFRPSCVMWNAHFKLNTDISPLLPYINAAIEDSRYFENPPHIIFSRDGVCCSLYRDRVNARYFEDRDQALEFIDGLFDYLNELSSNRDRLRPDKRRAKPRGALEIYRMLPGTNCRECGFQTCLAFATHLSKGKAVPEQCPQFSEPLGETAIYPVYDENGNLVSTVELDINVSQRRLNIERRKRRLGGLEGGLQSTAHLEAPKRLDINLDGIRVSLTRRELEVLRLLVEGFTNTEISRMLAISHHTVKTHVINIFNKLGVNDRTSAAVIATRHGFI